LENERSLHPFVKTERIHFRISLFMLLVSIIFCVIGYVMVQATLAVPEPVTYFVIAFLYAHVLHFGFGIYRLFYFFIKVHKQALGIKIVKTVISILISPISAFIAWLAVFLMVISSCSA
jgi:uncharacterized RDD family membrane protein YckC